MAVPASRIPLETGANLHGSREETEHMPTASVAFVTAV
jgi:hypothetical protein